MRGRRTRPPDLILGSQCQLSPDFTIYTDQGKNRSCQWSCRGQKLYKNLCALPRPSIAGGGCVQPLLPQNPIPSRSFASTHHLSSPGKKFRGRLCASACLLPLPVQCAFADNLNCSKLNNLDDGTRPTAWKWAAFRFQSYKLQHFQFCWCYAMLRYITQPQIGQFTNDVDQRDNKEVSYRKQIAHQHSSLIL